MKRKHFLDKLKSIPYKLGDLYSSKRNTFYAITMIDYYPYGFNTCRISLTRISKKNMRSQGNIVTYNEVVFKDKMKPLTDAQKLLYVQEEPNGN